MTTRRSTSALPRVKPHTDREALPRFRSEESAPLPSFELDDESGPRARAAHDSDSDAVTEEPFAKEEPFDAAPTRLRSTTPPPAVDAAAFFEVAPTKVRPRAVLDAALDDVLEDLRVATGHAPGAPELSTSALMDPEESLEIEGDESELVEMRRPQAARDVWNVHAAHPPRAPMVTVRLERPVRRSRVKMLVTALFFGAAIAAGVIALFLLHAA